MGEHFIQVLEQQHSRAAIREQLGDTVGVKGKQELPAV